MTCSPFSLTNSSHALYALSACNLIARTPIAPLNISSLMPHFLVCLWTYCSLLPRCLVCLWTYCYGHKTQEHKWQANNLALTVILSPCYQPGRGHAGGMHALVGPTEGSFAAWHLWNRYNKNVSHGQKGRHPMYYTLNHTPTHLWAWQ